MIPITKYRAWTTEEIMEHCSNIRFDGSPMIHRTIEQFSHFVDDSIHQPKSLEYVFVSGFGGLASCRDESERFRRWVELFAVWCEDMYGGKER